MNKNNQWFISQGVIYLLLGIILVSPSVLARRSRDDSSNRPSREEQKQMLKEQKRQEAIKSFPELDSALKTILESVSKNQKPNSATIERAAQVLDDNKRNGWAYDAKQKTRFMLLQAWAEYYQENVVDALRWSMRACKTNQGSQDAWISQALFSMIVGKRPMLPRLDKPKERPARSQNSRRRHDEEFAVEASSVAEPYSETGELKFDLLGLRTELFRTQFNRMNYKVADGSEIEYVPGEDILCILFWQIEDAVSDANDLSSRNRVQQQMAPVTMGQGTYNTQEKTLQSQRDYVCQLKYACQDKPEIKFVQINVNKADASKRAAEEAVQDLHVDQAGPLIFAADPASKAQGFMSVEAVDPFLMIVDTEGKVRYAGTAADFVPAFILTELTGVELDLEKMNQTQQPQTQGQPADLSKSEKPNQPLAPKKTSPKLVSDPNEATDDPNTVNIGQSGSKSAKRSRQQTTEELSIEYQAGKDLEYAETFIDLAKKRAQTYKKGVDMCRDIIKKYPGTKYEEKARLLLREVPEHKRKTYKITDEELGL